MSEIWDGLASRMDPVPPHVIAAAKASLAWRDPDTELAALVEQHGLAEVRGESELLTFESGSLTIEVEVRGTALHGQLVPPQPARIRLDHDADPLWTEADALGRFAFEGVARGPIRLTCYPGPGGGAVRTAWTRI